MLSRNAWIAPCLRGLKSNPERTNMLVYIRSCGTDTLIPPITQRITSAYRKCGYSVTLAPPRQRKHSKYVESQYHQFVESFIFPVKSIICFALHADTRISSSELWMCLWHMRTEFKPCLWPTSNNCKKEVTQTFLRLRRNCAIMILVSFAK